MKTLFIAISSFFLLVPSNGPKKCCLTVKLTNIQNQKGVIELSLYKDPILFPKVGQTYRMVRIKPDGNELIYHFVNLDAAPYAVCTYHDENNNKVCDKNMIGIPTEAYAFSNNFRPKWSAPDFEDCSLMVDKDKTVSIKMVY
ncbi:MAG: DUF2141 domain-containing protein [Flavobacteriia bacterium]|jgi:uncharacterized protein (DUF2141 family)